MAEYRDIEIVENPQKGDIPGWFRNIIPPVWAHRKSILRFTLAVTVITGVLNYFVLPLEFTAVATLLPETERDKVTALSQVADIAELAGVSIPGSEIALLYPAIVSSESVLRKVIERRYPTNTSSSPLTLTEYFEFDQEVPAVVLDETIKRLRASVTATFDHRTNIVTITAEMPEPQLAADVLNAIVAELDKFMREKRTTNATEQRKWLEERREEVGEELRTSENTLKSFRERNRRTLDSPELLLQEQRLIRDVEIQSTLFIELTKQHELARIEEIKNTTVVNILDGARAPVRKSGPRRAANTVLMFLVSFVIAIGYHAFRSRHAARLTSLWNLLREGKKTLPNTGPPVS